MNFIQSTIERLNEASYRYYNGLEPIMSDAQYDDLYIELENWEKENGIILSGSPTQKVGAPILDSIEKYDLSTRPMLSLEKVYTDEEVNSFIGKEEVVATVKCDGLSTRLVYENGELIEASTRGDGVEGGFVLNHVKNFINVPLHINYKNRITIDGESIIKINHFNMVNKNNEFKNPRNLAAGTLNTLDMKIVKQRQLSFIAWDVIGENEYSSYIDTLCFLGELGFQTVPFFIKEKSETVEEINIKLMSIAERANIPCDGVVWKYDNIEYGNSLGRTAHHFKNAVAWKPKDKFYNTKLESIEWTIGRTGALTPVAYFEPVETEDSTINAASLHNINIMESLLNKPFVGQNITVYKSNMIIPQVFGYDHNQVVDNPQYLEIPEFCPICGGNTEIDNGILYCHNSGCMGQLINYIDYFVGKKGLNIKGLSKATLEKLIDWGWINTISDIYELHTHEKEWKKKPGFGIKSVDNILEAIEKSKNCTLEDFLSAIGIPLVGRSMLKSLLPYVKDYEDFRNKVNEKYDWTKIRGFADAKSYNINNFNYEIADEVFKYMNIDTTIVNKVVSNNDIKFKVVITGKLNKFKNRTEFKNKIEECGGKVVDTVNNSITCLINNSPDSNTSKNLTAKKLGIDILTEEEFCEKFLTL